MWIFTFWKNHIFFLKMEIFFLGNLVFRVRTWAKPVVPGSSRVASPMSWLPVSYGSHFQFWTHIWWIFGPLKKTLLYEACCEKYQLWSKMYGLGTQTMPGSAEVGVAHWRFLWCNLNYIAFGFVFEKVVVVSMIFCFPKNANQSSSVVFFYQIGFRKKSEKVHKIAQDRFVCVLCVHCMVHTKYVSTKISMMLPN